MEQKWWQKAVGYEIFPSSFYDTNNDGIGDLNGIIAKLDYLKTLGVNLLWICPFMASPMDDNGYDVSDFFTVNPLFGTNDDLERLIEEVHARDMKIIMDFVLNHTSDEHAWFQQARLSKDNRYRDFYIWQKGKIDNQGRRLPPNNWRGFFSDSAWAYDPLTDEYYMKIFSKKMPDLNWENPNLRQEIYKVARHYLKLGIDGFRLDAIAHLARDLSFSDSGQQVEWDGLTLDSGKFSNRDRLFDYLAEFKREVLDLYPEAMTVGEVGGGSSTMTALRYADKQDGAINMVFNFDTCWENGAYDIENKRDDEIRTHVRNLKATFKRWYDDTHQRAWLPLYWVNHDHPRVLSQYGSVKYRKQSAKMLATVLLFMYGTPFLYQGEEIGMANVDYTDINDFFIDVSARNYYEEAKKRHLGDDVILRVLRHNSRVNARTPFQWNDSAYAGFSSVEPRTKVVGDYPSINVEQQQNDPDSILNFYKKALRLRQEDAIYQTVTMSDFALIDADNDDVFAYHHHGEKHLVVIANFRDYSVDFTCDIINDQARVLLHNYPDAAVSKRLHLRPFECYLLEIGG